MKLPAYPRYKPSGVEWLGDVPEHWKPQCVRFCYSIQLGKMLQPEPSSPTDEETPYLKSQHVQWEHVRVTELPTMWTNMKERRQYAVKDGDLLVCEGGDVGRAAVVRGAPEGTIIQNALHRVRPQDENETGFLLYVLAHAASQEWFEIICNRSTIAHFTVDKFGALGVALPTPAEQRAIAAFLDRETGRIDALVAKKRELIERLKEKRTALISRTVTRGLPPAAAQAAGLPVNPPMKDSGIEWLGEIPGHWEVRRLKDVGTLRGGAGFPHEEQGLEDEELPFYKVGDLKASLDGRVMTKPEHTISKETARKLRAAIIPQDSIIYAKIGAALLLNRRRVTFCDCCIDNNMTAYLPRRRGIRSEWAFYWLTILDFGEFMNPGAVPSFSEGYQGILPILLPPPPEQRAIANYLDKETAKLDALVAKVEEAIERLQEYRSALITAAVTGKIDVRGRVGEARSPEKIEV